IAFFIIEILFLVICGGDYRDIVILWLIEKVLVIPLVLYVALAIHKLLKGSEALVEGNLSAKVDTKYLIGSFKEQGDNLNSIAQGLNVVVEERMKSERLKTELITNVSHDIKTPLTSIINYADLIVEEPTENGKITEYAEVLKRQSARLKKLIEDLMEASKASTGNIEVNMMPCEVGVLLTQTMGEYEQRLAELGLELIARQPEQPVRIMADGKLLWRVFDNLLNNICKYAMGGTRVYLTVEDRGDVAAIAFKNISRYPLDVSAEELKERFVRGDKSRHTEGNGLGLSITQSLTQLQGGQLELTVDGDFFKVVLFFQKVSQS
ncbi:MAG: sensor histidine kinase, partial [Lachnospiraceae bacterium]|nr:sensor histidine kinase [Lachnospiraceae bacterium]